MTFIAAGLIGGLSKAIWGNNRELDTQAIKSQLASFPFNNYPIVTSQEVFAKDTLAYLLTTPGAKFQDHISSFIDRALPNFVNIQSAKPIIYDSQTEVFGVFKEEFNTLINNMLGTIFQGSDRNPQAQTQKQAFQSNLDKFWTQQSNTQEVKHADALDSLISVVNNPVTPPPINRSHFSSSPATIDVTNQVAAGVSSPVNAPAAFDPTNPDDLFALSTNALPDTVSKVKIPHAQLREYAQAYGALLQGTLSESVLKLAINSVNPGIRLDVASEAIPEIEKFIRKCIEADGIRLAEWDKAKKPGADLPEIQTLTNSPNVQENLNEILKVWGLEYDFQTRTLNQNALSQQVLGSLEKMFQLPVGDSDSAQDPSRIKIDNLKNLQDVCESIVDKKNTSITHLSLLDYPNQPASLLGNLSFEALITESNRSDLIIELPHSKEIAQRIEELRNREFAKDPDKLIPTVRFILPSLEDSSIDALRGLIKQAATKAEPNAEISTELQPTLGAYASKTSAERSRVKELLISAVDDNGYGLDAVQHKPYIDYVLNAIAPESVKGFNDVYDLKEYQSNLAEAFKDSLIRNHEELQTVRDPIQAVIKQAREVEENFKPDDNLPKISGVLEKALFAAKPDRYKSLSYFYWVERGLSHPELLKELALGNQSLKNSALSETEAGKLLNTYFEIATELDKIKQDKKLSQLISEGLDENLLIEKFKLIDTAMETKYSDYLSQNSSYPKEARPSLSHLAVFEDLRKGYSDQVSSFIEKEINLLESVNPSSLVQVSKESINLYKQLFISGSNDISFITREFLFKSLIEFSDITDEAIKVSTDRIDKLIEDFNILDLVLLPSFATKMPHLSSWAVPLLNGKSTTWRGERVSVRDSLSSYKDLDLQGLLNESKQTLQTLFRTDAYKLGPDNRLYTTDEEKRELLNYIEKFNITAKPADIYRQEFEDRAKAAFLNPDNKTAETFNQAIDIASARVNLMQNDSFESLLRAYVGHNLYPLVKPFTNVSPEDQEALKEVQSSLKTDNSAANFLNLINLNSDDLIQLGVEAEQASRENLMRYIRYQESPNNDALKLDIQARYKDLAEGDNPVFHAEAIIKVGKEFKEFLQAYDSSQLATRLEEIGKKLESKGSADAATEPLTFSGLTNLATSPVMRNFSSELGSVNPTNIFNKPRIESFIDSNSYELPDGSFMLALRKKSPEQEREYIHLNPDEYKDFRQVMASYLAENINLNQNNIRRDDLIVPASETAQESDTVQEPETVQESDATAQEPETPVSKDPIDLNQNALKIYTLASGAEPHNLENFTLTTNITHNLNLGDYAREALLELNSKQSQEEEEKTLITDTFKSLRSADSQDISARFAVYEKINGTLPETYKNQSYNNFFLNFLEVNLVNPAQAAKSFTEGMDKALSSQGPVSKTRKLEIYEKMFKIFDEVYLEIFSNAETSSGASLGKGKIKPLMENEGIQAYFEKNKTAGVVEIQRERYHISR
jgi:hypothetical protein